MTMHIHDEEEYRGRWSLGAWRRLLDYSPREKKYLLAMAIIASIMAGIDTSFTLVSRRIFDSIATEAANGWITWIGVYAGLVLVFGTGIWTFIWIGGRISTYIGHDVRQAAFERLQQLSFSYFDHRPVGWLVTRLTTDCDRLARIFAWGMLDLVWGTLFLITIAGAMLYLNWRLALIVLAVLPPLGGISLVFQRRLLHTSRAVRKTNSRITAAFNEAIMGVRTTKALVREDENLAEFDELTGQMQVESVHNAVLHAAYWPTIMVIGSLGVGLAVWFGGEQARIPVVLGGISTGTLLAFVTYARQFFMPIQELTRVMAELQHAQAAAERVVGLLEAVPEVRDTPEALRRMALAAESVPVPGMAEDGLPDAIRSVEFRDVGFRYDENQQVLDGFSLTVSEGQTIALVGPTGGGKTTVVSLVARFYEPQCGGIFLDGIEYRERSLHWLQSNLGIVLQTPHLFSGTIRENIRFGRLDATDEEIEEAARVVCAHPFISALPEGYETVLGESGTSLSLGQKQLLSFARAVLADPRILVMDEATSSIDTETEHTIQQALHRVLAGRISFVIAHRLSTIRTADQIVFIRDGRIVEKGTHTELLQRRGEYYALYTEQFTREETAAVLR